MVLCRTDWLESASVVVLRDWLFGSDVGLTGEILRRICGRQTLSPALDDRPEVQFRLAPRSRPSRRALFVSFVPSWFKFFLDSVRQIPAHVAWSGGTVRFATIKPNTAPSEKPRIALMTRMGIGIEQHP